MPTCTNKDVNTTIQDESTKNTPTTRKEEHSNAVLLASNDEVSLNSMLPASFKMKTGIKPMEMTNSRRIT